MSEKLIVDILGWIGSIEVVLAYALISQQKITSKNPWYQWLNLTGAILLIVNTWYYGAWPSTFINLVWVGIAIVALSKLFFTRKKQG